MNNNSDEQIYEGWGIVNETGILTKTELTPMSYQNSMSYAIFEDYDEAEEVKRSFTDRIVPVKIIIDDRENE